MCGEKKSSCCTECANKGSPPRVRGKALHVGGNRHDRKDHPRVCGEKIDFSKIDKRELGSPPRVRGKA